MSEQLNTDTIGAAHASKDAVALCLAFILATVIHAERPALAISGGSASRSAVSAQAGVSVGSISVLSAELEIDTDGGFLRAQLAVKTLLVLLASSPRNTDTIFHIAELPFFAVIGASAER